MASIAVGASVVLTVAVGTYLEGTGAGSAVIGRAAVFQPLTAGDAWQIGPFTVATSVGITAAGAITYTVKDVMQTPSAADKFSRAVTDALPPLVSADGNGTTPQDRLIRATDDGAALIPRAHPNYHCHFFAGDYFADANRISDRSGQENHAVLMSALTGAVAGATAGYISTAAALNQMWEIPDPNIDLFAGDSYFLHWAHNMTRPGSTVAIFGNGAASPGAGGVRVSATTTDAYQVVWYNAAGTLMTGGSSTAAGVNTAGLSDVLKSFSMLWDGQALKWSAWLNGALVRTESAFTVTGSTASTLRQRVGGATSSDTGTVAAKTRALVQMKWGPTEAVPTTAAFTAAIAKLIALPGQLLLDGDL